MKSILFVLLSFVFSTALAGTAQGTISKLHTGPAYGTLFFVTVSAASTGMPACKTNPAFSFAFDSAAPAGKNTLALLMLAYTTGKSVTISGENRCSLYSDTEDLRWVLID
jgi:hypothetical protein